MLSNKSFLKKAPKDVVSKTKSTKTKLLNKINEIEKFLSENLM
jgi:valyl-tRNA synthetase